MTDDLDALLAQLAGAPDPLEQALTHANAVPPTRELAVAIDALAALAAEGAPIEQIIEQRRAIAELAARPLLEAPEVKE